jgi:hypothetical protein
MPALSFSTRYQNDDLLAIHSGCMYSSYSKKQVIGKPYIQPICPRNFGNNRLRELRDM